MNDQQVAAYVDAACAANGIALTAQERERVIGHFARTVTLAAPLLELPLPADVEMAAVFRP
jgi:Protein of unknown function (DUF4089)